MSEARLAANKAGSVSVARVEANRRNAQKSTGPRTEAGKARVSQNALKHGLRSERNPLDPATDTTLPIERDEFLATLSAFTAEFNPQTPLETRLVERLAQLDLRLNRAMRLETAQLDQSAVRIIAREGGAFPQDDPRARDNYLLMRSFLDAGTALTLIARYESRLSRDFARTLAQLRQVQSLRAKNEAQKFGNQTQPPETPRERTATEPCTIPTRSHASDGMVAPSRTEPLIIISQTPSPSCATSETGNQTQPSTPQAAAPPSPSLQEMTKQTHQPAESKDNAAAASPVSHPHPAASLAHHG